MDMLKLWSWNVNGLRAILKKGFLDVVLEEQPDILGIQETKLQEDQIPKEIFDLPGYRFYTSHAVKKGYSGTMLLMKHEPLLTWDTLGTEEFDGEGRITAADFGKFIVYNIYFPNGQMNDDRLQYKLNFYDYFIDKMRKDRDAGKNLIICGDYNTAHKPIDLTHPKANENYSGFMPIERERLDTLIDHGFVDTFRYFDDRPQQYSWWSYIRNAREKNVGWRIDYFFVNQEMLPHVKRAYIRQDIFGSDHCPVGLDIEI